MPARRVDELTSYRVYRVWLTIPACTHHERFREQAICPETDCHLGHNSTLSHLSLPRNDPQILVCPSYITKGTTRLREDCPHYSQANNTAYDSIYYMIWHVIIWGVALFVTIGIWFI